MQCKKWRTPRHLPECVQDREVVHRCLSRLCSKDLGKKNKCLCRRAGRACGVVKLSMRRGAKRLLERQVLRWCKRVWSRCKNLQRFQLTACQDLQCCYALLQAAKWVAHAVPRWVLWKQAVHRPLSFLLQSCKPRLQLF